MSVRESTAPAPRNYTVERATGDKWVVSSGLEAGAQVNDVDPFRSADPEQAGDPRRKIRKVLGDVHRPEIILDVN